MKKTFLIFFLFCIANNIQGQIFKIEDLIKADCKSLDCVSPFLTTKGYYNWKKDLQKEKYLSTTKHTQRSGYKKLTAPNMVTAEMDRNKNFLLIQFFTVSSEVYSGLSDELSALGFRPEGKVYTSTTYPLIIVRKFTEEGYEGFTEYYIDFFIFSKGKQLPETEKTTGSIKEQLNRTISNLLPKSTVPMGKALKFFYYERYTSAEAEFQKNIKINPQSAEDYYWQVLTLLALNKKKEANVTADAGIKATGNNPLLQVAKGHVLIAERESSEAMKIFEAVKKETNKKNASILLAIARAIQNERIGSDNLDYGVLTIKEALEAGAATADMLTILGQLYRKQLDAASAYLAFTTAAKMDPQYGRSYYLLGRIFESQQNDEMLLESYNKAIKADPQYAPAYLALHLYYSFRDANKATQYLGLYLKNTDPSCENYIYEADYLFRVAKYNESLAKLSQIENGLCKDNARINAMQASNYNSLGDSVKAKTLIETFFSRAASDDPLAADYKLAADLYARFKGQEALAETYYQKTIDADTSKTNRLNAALACAKMFAKAGDYKKKAAWYQKIVNMKANPSNVDLFELGTAYYYSGDYKGCKSAFDKYAEKSPSDWRGPLFQARASSQIDATMTTGEAAPYYEKYLSLGATDPANKKATIEAYMYLFAVSINLKKDKALAGPYLDKVLSIDPANAEALKYKDLIK